MVSLSLTAAVSILTELATRPGETWPSELLAWSRKLDGGATRRLLARLAGAGLVRIRRGANGGAALGRPAAEITLLAVLAAISTPSSSGARRRASEVAGRRRHLGPLVDDFLAAADQRRDEFLSGVTIDDLAIRLRQLDREWARQAARHRRCLVEPRPARAG